MGLAVLGWALLLWHWQGWTGPFGLWRVGQGWPDLSRAYLAWPNLSWSGLGSFFWAGLPRDLILGSAGLGFWVVPVWAWLDWSSGLGWFGLRFWAC